MTPEETAAYWRETDKCAFVAAYAQRDNHDAAAIVGNFAGLKALRDAIDTAMAPGIKMATARVIAPDGEGYIFAVVRMDTSKLAHSDKIPGWYVAPPSGEEPGFPVEADVAVERQRARDGAA